MNTRIEKIKKHFRDNKKIYLLCGGTAVLSVVGTAFVVRNGPAVKNVTDSYNLKIKSPTTTEVTTVVQIPARGHRGNIIVDNTTGVPYASQNQAAKALDLSPVDLSRHLNGHRPDVKGHTFTKLGENLGEELTLAV